MKKKVLVRGLVILGLLSLFYFNIRKESPFSPNNPKSSASRFLNAVEKNDFETIFNLSECYQTTVSRIKANNPKILWNEKLRKYYESVEKEAWKTEEIQAIKHLLSYPCKWKILESKKAGILGAWNRTRQVFKVFVSFTYSSSKNSPFIRSGDYGGKIKRRTMVFYVDPSTKLIVASAFSLEENNFSIYPLKGGDLWWVEELNKQKPELKKKARR